MSFKAVLDACVLVPSPLFDTLLRLAEADLFVPIWSDEILWEVERTLTGDLGLTPDQAKRRIGQMAQAFPDSLVGDFAELVSQMRNDPKDRHVLAAAVRSGARIIVTANLKHFPGDALVPYEIVAVHPDNFLQGLLGADPDTVMDCLREQQQAYINPPLTMQELYQALIPTVPYFVLAAESLEGQESY